jgi:hypothetical protein
MAGAFDANYVRIRPTNGGIPMDEHPKGSERSEAWHGFQAWNAALDEDGRNTLITAIARIGVLVCLGLGMYSIGPSVIW